jgi:thiamine biosynthesis lipoprotein
MPAILHGQPDSLRRNRHDGYRIAARWKYYRNNFGIHPMPNVLIPSFISSDIPRFGEVIVFQGSTMGTTWAVKLVTPAKYTTGTLQAGIQGELDQVVNEMSHWLPESDLSRFNRAAAGSWHKLPEDFFTVLSYALSVAKDSEGAYDPAAGAIVNLWGFGAANRYDQPGFTVPNHDAIQAVLRLPGWRHIELDSTQRQVRQPGNALLDFSAIAKGYGVDKLARYLESQGIHHYLVEVGGELRGAGMKPDGQPWWVALERPPLEGSNPTMSPPNDSDDILLALHGLSVATSGDYRRCFAANGTVYAHTLDPRSGYPVSNGIASVTVIHTSCMMADALSTALTVLGVKKGLEFAEAKKLAARFLVRHNHTFAEHTSSAFRQMLQ